MAIKQEIRRMTAFNEVELGYHGEAEIVLCSLDDPQAYQVMVEADEAVIDQLRCDVHGSRLVLDLDVAWWEWAFAWWNWMYLASQPIKYVIHMPRVQGLKLSGSGRLAAPAAQGELVELKVSGSGEICVAQAEAATLRLKISGSGRLAVDQLKARALLVNISGSGSLLANHIEAESVESHLSGAGELALNGTALSHRLHLSGAGHVDTLELALKTLVINLSGSGRVKAFVTEQLDIHLTGSGEVLYSGKPQMIQKITGSGMIRSI